jgi:hypothetical protein
LRIHASRYARGLLVLLFQMYLPHDSLPGQMPLSGRPVDLDVQYLNVEHSLTLPGFEASSSYARVHLVPPRWPGGVGGLGVGSVGGTGVTGCTGGVGVDLSGHLNEVPLS